MFKFMWILHWKRANLNWRNTRQKRKAMRKDFEGYFRVIASDSVVYTVFGL